MKRIFFWLTILALVLVSINNEQSLEITQRSIVHAIGIDYEHDEVTITLQVFRATGPGGDTHIDQSTSNTFVVSNTADNFDNAMLKCENQLGSYLFIGHNQLIVFGSGVNFDNPKRDFSYFLQNKDNFLGVNVVLAETTAKELLQAELTTGAVSSENFISVIDMYQNNGETSFTDMLTLINSLEGGDKSAVIPIVSVRSSAVNNKPGETFKGDSSQMERPDSRYTSEDSVGDDDDSAQDDTSNVDESSPQNNESVADESEEHTIIGWSEPVADMEKIESETKKQQLIEIKKVAVIRDGKIFGTLNPHEVQGLNWMTKRTNFAVINTMAEDSYFDVTVKSRRINNRVEKKDDKLVFVADIKAVILRQDNVMPSASEKEITKAVEDQIEDNCQALIDKAYGIYNADVASVLHLVRFYYPQIYLDNEDDFSELIKNIDFEINVNCILD